MSLIGNVKDVWKVVLQIGNRELTKKFTALQSDAMALAEKNRQLKEENEELKKLLDLREDMEFVEDGSFYVRKSERDGEKVIPYCHRCFDSDRKVFHLKFLAKGRYSCDIHKTDYKTAEYKAKNTAEWYSANPPSSGLV